MTFYRLTDIADMIIGAAKTADNRQQPKIGRTLLICHLCTTTRFISLPPPSECLSDILSEGGGRRKDGANGGGDSTIRIRNQPSRSRILRGGLGCSFIP